MRDADILSSRRYSVESQLGSKNTEDIGRKSLSRTYLVDFGSPPIEILACAGEKDRQEDQHARNAHGRVHGRAENKVILAPPRVKSLPNRQAKDESYYRPTTIIHTSGWREIVQPAKEEWNMNSLPSRIRVSTAEVPNRDG